MIELMHLRRYIWTLGSCKLIDFRKTIVSHIVGSLYNTPSMENLFSSKIVLKSAMMELFIERGGDAWDGTLMVDGLLHGLEMVSES